MRAPSPHRPALFFDHKTRCCCRYEVHGTLTRMQTVRHGGGVWTTPSDQLNGLRVQEWDLVAGDEVEVVERVEVASSDLRFEREDLGLSPLRGDETWLRCCVGRSMHTVCSSMHIHASSRFAAAHSKHRTAAPTACFVRRANTFPHDRQ